MAIARCASTHAAYLLLSSVNSSCRLASQKEASTTISLVSASKAEDRSWGLQLRRTRLWHTAVANEMGDALQDCDYEASCAWG